MEIHYHAFGFTLEAKEIIVLPSYKGSTLRGGFGNAFKKVVCAIRKHECSDCILKEKCIYSYVFETPPPSDTKIMRKYTSAPHPFVIEPPREKRQAYKPGDNIDFGLVLIGRAIDYLPYFIYTFDELGKIGIGKDRGKYELKEVKSLEFGVKSEKIEKTIYSSDTKALRSFDTCILDLESGTSVSEILNVESSILNLEFLTPTRLVHDGHLTLDLEFHMLIRQLLRRLSLLYYFHCGGNQTEWDFKGIIEKAQEVQTVKRELRWYDWERYSARQDTRMKMGGLTGAITFKGDIGPFMPFIKAGEVLHVGKGTSFGLGKFKIQDSKFKMETNL